MGKWAVSLLLIVVICFQSLELKANSTLLSQMHRPTMSEFLKALDPFPDQNPFPPFVSQDAKRDALMSKAPELIAQIEFAFPGVVWAPLGRDSSFIADILEAFYLTYDLPNRVVRLNASSPSFTKPEHYMGLLKSAGLVDGNGAPIQPFVILDPTSWRIGSQSRSLVSAVYQSFPPERRRELLNRVNCIAAGNSDGNANSSSIPIRPGLDRDQFFKDTLVYDNGPERILRTIRDFSYLYYNSDSGLEISWHDKFQPFLSYPDGNIYSPPGPASSNGLRNHILWFMYEVKKVVQSVEFHKKVFEIAKDYYGYDFADVMKQSSMPNGLVSSSPTSMEFDSISDFKNEIDRRKRILSVISSNYSQEVIQLFEKHYAKIRSSQDFSLFLDSIYLLKGVAVHFQISREIGRIIGKNVIQTLQYELSVDELKRVYMILPQENREAFARLHLRSALNSMKDGNRFLDLVRGLPLVPDLKKKLVFESLDEFFLLNPSVTQINHLIEVSPSSRTLHREIATRALEKITSKEDYLLLKKPSLTNTSSRYREAKAKCKKKF